MKFQKGMRATNTNGSDTSVFRDLNNKQIILLLSQDVRRNLKMIRKAFKKRQMNFGQLSYALMSSRVPILFVHIRCVLSQDGA